MVNICQQGTVSEFLQQWLTYNSMIKDKTDI
jgi:hypothetical protein